MKKVMFIAVLCLVLSVGCGAAGAQSVHDRADADNDGVVTKEDMKKALEERYRGEDANKDGKVSVDEYQDARRKNFDDADANRDGVVTVEEWAIYWCGTDKDAAKAKKPVKMGKSSRAKLMDANKDGKIGKDECVVFWAGRFKDLDGNKDGKMSREEYLDRMIGMAKTMDLDGDGVITIEEYYVSWVGKDSVTIKNKPAGKTKKPAAQKTPAEK
jgi:Ca2+-binding EF-hand superfamily protein